MFVIVSITEVPLQQNATTFVYLGGYNSTLRYWSTEIVPFTLSQPPVANTAKIRLINAAYVHPNQLTATMHTENFEFTDSLSTAVSSLHPYGASIFGQYITVPSNVSIPFVVDGYDLRQTLVLRRNSRSSLVFFNSGNGSVVNYELLYLDETPVRASYPADPQLRNYRFVNTSKDEC